MEKINDILMYLHWGRSGAYGKQCRATIHMFTKEKYLPHITGNYTKGTGYDKESQVAGITLAKCEPLAKEIESKKLPPLTNACGKGMGAVETILSKIGFKKVYYLQLVKPKNDKIYIYQRMSPQNQTEGEK